MTLRTVNINGVIEYLIRYRTPSRLRKDMLPRIESFKKQFKKRLIEVIAKEDNRTIVFLVKRKT